MACDLPTSTIWLQPVPIYDKIAQHTAPPSDSYSPSSSSTSSATYSDSDDSVSAPSSQSSVAPSDWSSSDNELDNRSWPAGQPPARVDFNSSELSSTLSYHFQESRLKALSSEFPPNPRRTQRLNSYEYQDGQTVVACPRPPPSLVRQSERKENFVDTLVGKLTLSKEPRDHADDPPSRRHYNSND